MTSMVKIFRPWTADDEKNSQSESEAMTSQLSRVPEPGYPATDFITTYENLWHHFPTSFDEFSAQVHTFPYATNNLAQRLSYLDPTYLSIAFDELQENAKTSRKLKQRPKKFRCPHCKVSFSNNGQLKGHVRIHTGERPFKCDSEKCGKSFTRNEELTRHKRIHTGLRPFPCEQCGKRFGRKDHLKKHVRTHFPQPRYVDANLLSLYPVLFGY